ncbi:MAG TPA: (2Fe-2S) ferredoxin domain-containing protein, partial [Lachnospiraceae bacterium]|nr:(2Fe-2S) ferredoxin domain-containing protein [Lachnospiraceae bacterium]
MKKLLCKADLEAVRAEASKEIRAQECRILICAGTGCLAGGSLNIYKKMCELTKDDETTQIEFGEEIAHGPEVHASKVGVKKSGCHGFCEMG